MASTSIALLPAQAFRTGLLLCLLLGGSLNTAAFGAETSSRADSRAAAAKKLELNTATLRALAAVPVIGADGAEAIVAARPFTRIDDLNRLTGISAERLEQIRTRVTVSPETIPPHEKEKAGRSSVGTGNNAPKKLNVNTASYDALAASPAVGPEIAHAIIAARPFETLDELSRIRGISTERLAQLRLNLTIRGDQRSVGGKTPAR